MSQRATRLQTAARRRAGTPAPLVLRAMGTRNRAQRAARGRQPGGQSRWSRHRAVQFPRPSVRGGQPLPAHGLPPGSRHRAATASSPATGITRASTSPPAGPSTNGPMMCACSRFESRTARSWLTSPSAAIDDSHFRRRLEDGLERDIPLVIAKSVIALIGARRRSAPAAAGRRWSSVCATGATAGARD